MRFKKYSKEDFIEAIASSTSIRQVLSKLNLKEAGGNYQTVKNGIKNFNLDTSHFLGQAIHRGKNFGPKRPLSDYLSNKHKIGSHKLRLRLLKEGYFEHKCYKCDNIEWDQQPIPLELEHIDGDHFNNNLDNLTLLCPNCHAQTPTYRRSKTPLSR